MRQLKIARINPIFLFESKNLWIPILPIDSLRRHRVTTYGLTSLHFVINSLMNSKVKSATPKFRKSQQVVFETNWTLIPDKD